MKNFKRMALVVSVTALAGYTAYSAYQIETVSKMSLANIEALANDENSNRFLDVKKDTVTIIDEYGNKKEFIYLDCQNPDENGELCE